MNLSDAIAGVSVAMASLRTDFDDVDQPFEEGKLVKPLICAGLSILASAAAAAHATEVVSPGNRAAYCRGEVSQQYGTKPIYVKTGKLKKDKDGTTSISARWTRATKASSNSIADSTRTVRSSMSWR